MPDNWFYYIVLVILLAIMIVLGFFIGYHYQGDQDAIEAELKAANKKVEELESRIKMDTESSSLQAEELEDIRAKFERYVKKLGANGEDIPAMMKEKAEELERGEQRKEIIEKLILWFRSQPGVPTLDPAEFNFKTEGADKEFSDFLK